MFLGVLQGRSLGPLHYRTAQFRVLLQMELLQKKVYLMFLWFINT